MSFTICMLIKYCLILFYVIQIILVMGFLMEDAQHSHFNKTFKTKKHFLLHLIPFYFIFGLTVEGVKSLKKSWKYLGEN